MTRTDGSAEPRTLDELRTIRDDEQLIRAVHAYLARGQQKLREARRLRAYAVRRLADEHGPAEAARRAGMSLSAVKMIRGQP